ncbi:MAG: hypothetical protein HYU36_12275 [Planctomycetes bacterium]|nr:hypothetical protein [Planctomycetota bacterium]
MRLGHYFSVRHYYRGPQDIPRLVLGGIFLAAAFSKSLDPIFFLRVLSQYKDVPIRTYGMPAVFGIILAEYCVGLCLLFNTLPRAATVGALLINGLFVGVLALHWGKKLDLGCGCFWGARNIVVGIDTFWKNIVLFALTLFAGLVAFRQQRVGVSGGA